MFLHESPLFPTLLLQAQKHFGIPIDIIEKDYFVTLLLRRILADCPFLVFKGGTSLSKCFHMIQRFSEDIDLGADTLLMRSERSRVKHAILSAVSDLGLLLSNPDDIRSRRDFNRYQIHYQTNAQTHTIKTQVIVETYFPITAQPIQSASVQSLIGEMLAFTGREDLIRAFDLFPFLVRAQSLERTLIDKLFALCDYYLSDNLFEHSRHMYDIHQLWQKVNRNEVRRLIPLVRAERAMHSSVCVSAKNGVEINQTLLDIVEKNVFRNDYEDITVQLLYSPLPYPITLQTLKTIADLHLF